MPLPFPGMDPYLEGYLWPDLHHRLATEISRHLTPRLRPQYVARLDIYMVEDQTITPAPLKVPVLDPVEVRLVTVEIRDVARNELVTSIEILSPVNKREPGLSAYRKKRERLRQAGVYILEIDLLRRGQRPVPHPQIPDAAYRVTLTRAEASTMEVWPLGLRDPLPVLPVPLRPPDADVPLELAAALGTVYDEAAYDLSIDYAQSPPPPPLSDDDVAWLEDRLQEAGLRQ